MRIGIGVPVGSPVASAPVAPNPNLLIWTDDFTNPAWIKTAVTFGVTGGDPVAQLLQDQSTSAAVRQTSTTAASSGAGATFDIFDVATSSTRYSVTATFDGLPYTFSVYLQSTEAGIGYRLSIDFSGGFIRCSLEDIGDVGSNYTGRAQLEQAASASTYVPRTT